ncbi:hypothetical protein [Streptomyces sp. NPDC057682]|uniref:hypothetical protein n=1 Tax=unclassified Streptomyces TaxID=2593676 RepID=UPI00364B8178
MGTFVRRVVLVATAAGVVVGMAMSSASAGTVSSWAVTPSGPYTAHADYPTLSVSAGTFECAASDVTAGSFQSVSPDGAEISAIDAFTSTGCGVGGIDWSMTMSETPWKINAVRPSESHANWVDITISDFSAHFGGLACDVDVRGLLRGHYENDSGKLVIQGDISDLVASNASCLGLFNDGEEVVFDASYLVTMSSTESWPVISPS